MASEEPRPNEEKGRVLPFEPRRLRLRPHAGPHGPSPVEGFGKYARSVDDRDDYRHRMKTNAIVLVFVGILVWCGIWLFDTIAEMRKNQECVLSGRKGCTPVNVPIDAR